MNDTGEFQGYGFGVLRLLALVVLGTLGALSLAASGVAAEPAGHRGLEAAVEDEMLQEGDSARSLSAIEKQERTQTNVERTSKDQRWAFGTAVIEAPKKKGYYPEGWLFVAEKSGNGWKVGLEGSSEFDSLAREAPRTVVDEEEKDLFAEQSAATTAARSTEFQSASRWFLRLPWTKGTGWKMSGGPHGWATGYDRPYSALDFTGGNHKVRAAAGGRVYRMCSSNRGWLRVVHRGGWSTDYYHLARNIKRRQGAFIERGSFLGYTGTDVSCGGAAYGRHVHFNLRYYTKPTSLDERTLGGWTFQVGSAYGGYAQRKSYIRRPGSSLLNFGP